MLAWARKVETQRVQAAVLNMLTELRQFDSIKLSTKVKEDKARTPVHHTTSQQPCRYYGGDPPTKTMPSIQQGVYGV